MSQVTQDLPRTLGALRSSPFSEAKVSGRSVKDELRQNLICKIQSGEPLFPGIIGYEDSVVPQVVNAVLSRHNFILLGLRGQAKTRLIRQLTTLLDDASHSADTHHLPGEAARIAGLRLWHAAQRGAPADDGEKALEASFNRCGSKLVEAEVLQAPPIANSTTPPTLAPLAAAGGDGCRRREMILPPLLLPQ